MAKTGRLTPYRSFGDLLTDHGQRRNMPIPSCSPFHISVNYGKAARTQNLAVHILSVMKNSVCITISLWMCFAGLGESFAAKFTLRDGRVIEGKEALLSRVDEQAGTPDNISRPITVIDDGLRFVYLAKYQILYADESQSPRPVTFKTGQRVNYEGKEYFIPGTYSNSEPFDKFGRRLLKIRHIGGIEYAEQAIVELTPYYVCVTGLRANNEPLNWNMRLATNAIPRSQMTPILMNLIDSQNLEDRLKLVQFYAEGGLYGSADAELEAIMLEWKDSPDALQRIRPLFLNVRQQKFQQILDELEFRWDSGQYHLVRGYITEMEQDPLLPERQVEPVRRFLRRYDETSHQCQEIVSILNELYGQLQESEKNDKIPSVIAEIERELNHTTLARLSAFQLYASDPRLSAAEKLAIGITGWYAGADADNSRLAVAVTLPETEKLIGDYLRSGKDHLLRRRILEQLRNMETSRPDLIAGILATMKPPLFSELPPENPELPGFYHLTIPNPLLAVGTQRARNSAEIRYTVQLPPDYNPYQRYPMVVSLNGLYQTPDMQIDWWTGSWSKEQDSVNPSVRKMRMGHATRYGYIVIAPEWNPPEAPIADYDFSLFSHVAVTSAVRNACQRFSVNTDKVFLSGHGIGGTAAWDIALAHPDMWAGAVLFNAVASKYIDAYRSAVRHVPLYLVWGEMEGDGLGTNRKWAVNANILNRYLQAQAQPGDVTAVRYKGRGMEGFYEEILPILEWMRLRQRTVVPLEFAAETLRPWDSGFWWVEMPNLPNDVPKNMLDPVDYPPKTSDTRPVKVESKLYRATNTLSVTTKPRVANVQVFLTPEMIDFRSKVTAKVNDKNFHPPNGIIEPDIEVMLEDARTRGDRIHPFWVMLEGR